MAMSIKPLAVHQSIKSLAAGFALAVFAAYQADITGGALAAEPASSDPSSQSNQSVPAVLPPAPPQDAPAPEKATASGSSPQAKADIDFGPYLVALQKKIKRAWSPPQGKQSRKIVVNFRVHKDGSLSDLRIDKSSSVPAADDAALQAVRSAAPFAQLPDGSPAAVDIQFSFDYNVLNAPIDQQPPFKQSVPGLDSSNSGTSNQEDAFEEASADTDASRKSTTAGGDRSEQTGSNDNVQSNEYDARSPEGNQNSSAVDNKAQATPPTATVPFAQPEPKKADDGLWLPLSFGGSILLLLSFLAFERKKEKQAVNLKGRDSGKDV